MAMSNAELEVALKSGLQRLVTALANKVAPDSLLLEGKSLAEITSLILAGKATTAGTADNALAVGGKDLTTLESERNAQLVAAIDALRIELEGDISNVTAESLGLGNVVNYGIATEEEALAGAVDKYVTAALAVKIAQAKIDAIVDAAPETLDTLKEISEALHNNPDIIDNLMSSIGVNATAIEALDTAVQAFEAKVMGYFDVDGNANNANLFAGKTLNEVLDMARDGVDMSNVVLKTDDFGPYTVALASDTTTQEVPILVETVDTAAAMAHIVRVGEVVTVEINDGEGNFAVVTEAEMGGGWVLIQEAIDAREGDFDQYFLLGSTNQEVTAAARTLKTLFEALELADKNTQTRITSEVEGLNSAITTGLAGAHDHAESVRQNAQQALDNWTESIQQNLSRIDAFAVETRQMAFDNQQMLSELMSEKVDVAGDISSNTVLVDETAIELSQVIADIKAEIASAGQASGESLALLEQKVDDFIAAKATGEEAIAGTDDAKYITALALKAALDALNLAGKLDVDAQAVDSAKLGGKSLEEVIADAQAGVDMSNLVFKTDDMGQYSLALASDVEGEPVRTFKQILDAFEVTLGEKATAVDLAAEVAAREALDTRLSGEMDAVEARATALEDRATALESDKLDATAQAVDSAKLEGKSIADLTASGEEAAAGVITDKFMTPGTAKEAFDARWAEKVGAAPETLDTIEEIALALRNNPDSLAAVETVAKQYTDAEVLAAIQQISGEDMVAGTTLASLYAQVQALQTSKLDATATAVNSEKLGGKSLMEVIDSAIQPGRLFYPVVHVNGSLEDDNYVMPTPADVWAEVKTNAVMEQVDTIYAVGVKRLLPGNLLALTHQEGMTLRGAVSEAQEGPGYVIMRAGIEDTEWEIITDPLLGCLARLSKHCVVVGDNTERFVPGQTLFYNGFEALSENVYYDWTLMADKEWEVATFTGTDLVIDSARYHRSEIRIQSTGPVTVTFDVPTDLPYEMEVRFVNQTGVEVTFAGSNVVSVPRMQQYTLTKVNGVVRAVRYTNTSVALAGDMDEAFFANPDYSAPQA